MRRELRNRSTRIAVAALAALGTLAVLVASGATRPVDQYAVDHMMPGLYPYVGRGDLVTLPRGRLVEGWNPDRLLNHIADRVTMPALIPFATLIVVLVLLLSRRIDRRVWLLGYLVALGAELLGKSAIHGESLVVSGTFGPLRLWKFDNSFPSGHATRALFLAGLVGAAWPRLGPLAALWALAVIVLLVLAGTHTPSDVVGGILLAAALVALCRRAGTARPEAQPA